MKIMVIGSGGREHALCAALANSPSATQIICVPGNPGIEAVARCVALKSHEATIAFCQDEEVALVIIGPEQPLVDGLADRLRDLGIAVIGPSQQASQLEGSKDFTKQLCERYDIPTAAFRTFDQAEAAQAYLATQPVPIVIKADGLAAGKGVTVAATHAEAAQAIDECFGGKFGAAGSRVVIEECMLGEEVSFFALCDGKDAVEIGSAQDHKRVGDGDTGPNTGGMGAYSPTPLMNEQMRALVMERIIRPAVRGMAQDGIPYQGILFAGLMMTADGPKLIEFNCRFGDPEAQVILPRWQGDIAAQLYHAATQGVASLKVTLSAQAALCVVMANRGYPGIYEKGSVIGATDACADDPLVELYHAGTGMKDGKLIATGGRVLCITALADDLQQAQSRAYRAIDRIDWPQGFCRRDIGWRAIEKLSKTA